MAARTVLRLAGPLAVVSIAAFALGQEKVPQETPWPHQVEAGKTTLTVYQPQIDSWDGYELEARAAVSASEGEGKATTYGIVQVTARGVVDKGTRIVTLDQYRITKADFPSAPGDGARWKDALQKAADKGTRSISLDRLESALGATAAAEEADGKPLRNDPPRIIFATVPAMLVYVDGEPTYRAVAGTNLERVINTRPLLLRDPRGTSYLHVFDGWMSAPSLEGRYAPLAHPPADLEKAKKAAVESRQVDLLTGQTSPDEEAPTLAKGPVPAIHVATTPSELIVTEGEPKWAPIQGTELLYAENTSGHLFKDVASQKSYVLISGRWFRSDGAMKEWEFVRADQLPADFARIPDDSPKENVKASVAGTPQAKEAAIAAAIPQTSAVKRKEVEMTPPKYDGEPQLRAISGTSLQYVVNTATPVLMVSPTSFYAVENGVWFTGASLNGPWSVATSVPAVVYSIPPDSPLHYVTYVRIYDVTADTVVVGYTPGYQGTYVEPVTRVVVYGTGYPYAPWIGTVWYGPPVTYGLGVSIRYTPWTGWTCGFGFGWSWGGSMVSVGWGWGAYPWWGPYGWGYAWGPPIYPSPYYWGGAAYGWPGGAAAWGPGGWAGASGNIYTQWGSRATVSRYAGGYNAWTGNEWASRVGTSYNSRTGIASAGQSGAVHNVYTGDYAAGARGVARGPGGTVAAGREGSIGNTRTGREVTAGSGVVYNPATGQSTSAAGIRGNEGGAVRIGDDVYAGHDGNVYRRTDGGWERHTGGGWSPANVGANHQLNREASGRTVGSTRTRNYQHASGTMHRTFRGGGRRRR